jgi:hypothetical protein
MEASKRVRVSEGFICHLLVLSALPSYKHAKRPGIPDKKRTATESSAEPHVRMSAATLDAWRQIPKKGKYNLHAPRQASGVRRVPAKCCSNTSVRAMQAFGGDRFSRVATPVTRSANPDGRSAAAIFFRARKSLVRTGRPPRRKPHLRLRPCPALQCASLLLPWVPNSFVVPIAIIVCHSAFSFCNSIDYGA